MLGAVIFVGLEHLTRHITGLSDIIIGLVLLIVVLGFPGGLIGGVERFMRAKKSALPAEISNTHTGHSATP